MSEPNDHGTQSKYFPQNPDTALSNAEVRVAIGEIVGFDYTRRLEARQSTSKHAIYFRCGELAAICNWLRFRTDPRPEPVQSFAKHHLLQELAERCEFTLRSKRLERVELQQVLQTLRSVGSDPDQEGSR